MPALLSHTNLLVELIPKCMFVLFMPAKPVEVQTEAQIHWDQVHVTAILSVW